MGKKQLTSKKRFARPSVGELEAKSSVFSDQSLGSPLSASDAPPALAVAVGAGIVATLLMPTDSISGALGEGLPLVAYWLLVPFLLTWWVARRSFWAEATGRVLLQRTAMVATYAWAPVLIWVGTVVLLRWDQGNNRMGLNMFWQYTGCAVCTVVLTVFASSYQRRRGLIQVFLFVCFGLAIHALHQYFISMPADRKMFELDPIGTMRRAGIDATLGSQEYQQFRNRVNSTEPFATFALANSLAIVLGVATVLGFGMAVGEWLKKRSLRSVLAWLLLTAVIGGVLVLTKSRAAWIGAAVGMAGLMLSLITSRRDLRPAVLMLSSLGSLALLLLGWFGYRQDPLVLLEATKSFQYRIEYWIATGRMIADHWLEGVGPGQFQAHYTWYKLPQASETVADPHNWLMEILATTGVGGLLAWCLFLGTIWRWRYKVLQIKEKFSTHLSSISDPVNPGSVKPEYEAEWGSPASCGALWDGGESKESNLWLYLGGYLGIVLAIVLGLPLGVLPDIVPLLWATIGSSLIGGWILFEQNSHAIKDMGKQGDMVSLPVQRSVLFWSSAVWGVALLAAGGWMVPGVCLPLWILLAIWIGAIGDSLKGSILKGSISGEDAWIWSVGRNQWVVMQVGKIALFAIFLWTAWNPVMNLLPVLNSLNSNPRTDVLTVQKASLIDPLDPRPRQFAARYWVEKSLSGTSTDQQKAVAAIEDWASRDPASAGVQRFAADWVWLMAVSKSLKGAKSLKGDGKVDEDLLNLATKYYRGAELRYPNDAGTVLQLAAIQEASGAHTSAVGLAERALQLDQSHSHQDRKLEIQSIWWPGFEPVPSTMGGREQGDFKVLAPRVLKRILGSTH